MDDELRDALRKFTAARIGEAEIERLMKEPEGMVDAWIDTRRLPPGPKTREEVLDFLAGLSSSGLTQFFKEYHAEHGCYPEPPDLSEPPSVLSQGPPAVWRGAMSDEVRTKIREYAIHHIDLHEIETTKVGREKELEFLTNRWAQSGLADALEKHYAETGRYPDYADLPKFNLKICF